MTKNQSNALAFRLSAQRMHAYACDLQCSGHKTAAHQEFQVRDAFYYDACRSASAALRKSNDQHE